MHTIVNNSFDLFIAKIEAREALSDEERSALRALPQTVVRFGGRNKLIQESDRPTQCALVTDGVVIRAKTAASGRRQIMSFHVPGDMVDLQTILFKVADHSIESARHATVSLIPHQAMLDAGARYPALARAFWFDTLVDAAIQRETLLSVGRRDARTRTAHLLCELVVRLRRAGRDAPDGSIDLHITQSDFADSLGITPIHMNRVLATLRRERLITLEGRVLTVHDWAALAAAGEFDDGYLHLDGPEGLHA